MFWLISDFGFCLPEVNFAIFFQTILFTCCAVVLLYILKSGFYLGIVNSCNSTVALFDLFPFDLRFCMITLLSNLLLFCNIISIFLVNAIYLTTVCIRLCLG